MTVNKGERAGRKVIHELAVAGPDTTEGALIKRLASIMNPGDVRLGLRWLKRRGWAEKGTGPADRSRSDLGNPWMLTDAGMVELQRRLDRMTAYELEQYRSGEQ